METGKPEQSHPSKTENRTDANQQNTKTAPIIVNVLEPQKIEAEAAEERREREEKAKLDRRLVDLTNDVAIFTGGLFAATIALFLATCALWWSTRRLVKGAEDTAKRQLRAYIHVPSTELTIHPEEIGGWTANVTIKNFGQTPAYNMTTKVERKICLAVAADIALEFSDAAI